MAIVRNLFRRFRFWKRTSQDFGTEQDLTRTLKQYEYYVYKIQNILVWENPSESLFSVAAVNLLFWVFVNLEWRFYGIIFTGLLLTTLHEAWIHQIWPEIRVERKDSGKSDAGGDEPPHPSVIMLSKLIESSRHKMRDFYSWLKAMREEHAGWFCSFMSGVFFALSLIGRCIPGLILSYIFLMLLLIGPGFWIHLISEETKKTICSRLESFGSMLRPSGEKPDGKEDEEYMLDETGENLAVLSQALDPDTTSDSFLSQGSSAPFSFATGVCMMPSHDDLSLDSMPTFSEFDLALEGGATPRALRDIEEFSDDSSNGANDAIGEIEFQSGHFNGDDSSEEEEKQFSADLTFTETDSNVPSSATSSGDSQRLTLGLASLLTSNLGTLGAVGQNIFSTVMNRGTATAKPEPPVAKNDSSDSLGSDEDFEMISHDDVS